MAGDAVEVAVGGHDSQRLRLLNCGFERREDLVDQVTFRDLNRGEVSTALHLSVAGEVFCDCSDVSGGKPLVVALNAFDRSHHHLFHEMSVFAKRLAHAAEARVADEVSLGRVAHVHAARSRLASDFVPNAVDELGVPACSHVYGSAEVGGAGGVDSVVGFGHEHGRDAVSAVFHEVFLEEVVDFCSVGGRAVFARVLDSSDAVFDLFLEVFAKLELAVLTELDAEVGVNDSHLSHLFLQAHFCQQGFDLLIDRVERLVIFSGGGRFVCLHFV